MRLGKIQKEVINHLRDSDGIAHIGTTCRSPRFDGLVFEQVEAAVSRLVAREIIKTDGAGIYKLGV